MTADVVVAAAARVKEAGAAVVVMAAVLAAAVASMACMLPEAAWKATWKAGVMVVNISNCPARPPIWLVSCPICVVLQRPARQALIALTASVITVTTCCSSRLMAATEVEVRSAAALFLTRPLASNLLTRPMSVSTEALRLCTLFHSLHSSISSTQPE